MRYSKIIILFLIVCLAVAGYFLLTLTREGVYQAWVATQDILPGVQITSSMIESVTLDKPIAGLNKDAIIGKTAIVRIPKGSVISTGVDTPREFSGSLVNVPVTFETAGLVGPGDVVELVGIAKTNFGTERSLEFFGQAQVAAVIDNKGKIHRYGPVNELPAVLVLQVNADKVAQILRCISDGQVYPILGGVIHNVDPDNGQ